MIEEIIKHNREFVAAKGYEKFMTSKYPDKRIAIVTCMDTRLVELLPAALGLRNGDVKIIKNAGGTITNPFDSTMRSLLVAVYELGVNEIMVIGHTECGVQGMDSGEMLELMRHRGISDEHISLMRHCGIDLDSWLHGFDDTARLSGRPSTLFPAIRLCLPMSVLPGISWILPQAISRRFKAYFLNSLSDKLLTIF